jgi:lysosomal alpha-mannosidase
LDEAKNQVAILTHHDAITGTSPQTTSDDYTSRLQSGYSAAKAVIQRAYSYIKYKQKSVSTEVFCDLLNVTECSITETNDKIAVTVYNPIARPVSQYIRVPVSANNYQVFDSSGQKVNQISVIQASDAVKHLSERHSNANYELTFRANDLPALGFTTYFIEKHNFLSEGKTFD